MQNKNGIPAMVTVTAASAGLNDKVVFGPKPQSTGAIRGPFTEVLTQSHEITEHVVT